MAVLCCRLRLGSHHQDLDRTSFRKTAIRLTAAAMMFGSVGTSALVSFPAAAQQAVAFNGNPACAKVVDSLAGIKCEIKQADERIKAAKERASKADATSTAAKSATSCMEVVGKDIEAAKSKGPLTPDMKSAFKARIEKCDRVSSL